MSGWIKLRRSLKDWEWYDDHNATRLLIHLLISVNYEDKNWKGVEVKAGSMVLSWATLSQNCGLTIQKCRTSMEKLISSKEVTRCSTNKFQVITLTKWEKIQLLEELNNKQPNNQITIKQQSNNNQVTTTKEDKEKEEDKELKKINKRYNFRKELINGDFEEKLVDEWMKVRKTKKLTNSETAFNKFLNEINKATTVNLDGNDILKMCVENSWGGFKASWLNKVNNEKPKKVNAGTLIKQKYGLNKV